MSPVLLHYSPRPTYTEGGSPYEMRRTIVFLATMALTLLGASGVALAVNKIGTNRPDTLSVGD